jgi:hypothetical protein
MFILLLVLSIASQFWGVLQVNRKSGTRHARIERLIESQLTAIVSNCAVKVVAKKLRCDPKICLAGSTDTFDIEFFSLLFNLAAGTPPVATLVVRTPACGR